MAKKKFPLGKILQVIIFLGIGLFIFWWVYQDLSIETILEATKNLDYGWIILSFIFGMISHASRAARWKMLIDSTGKKVRFINTYLAVFILYFVNLLIPRAGEIARVSVLSKYENIPFTRLLGTVFVERMTDLVMTLLLAVVIIFSNIQTIQAFFIENPSLIEGIKGFFSLQLLIILFLVAGIIIFIYLRWAKRSGSNFKAKIDSLKENFISGIRSVKNLKNPGLYIFHSVFIFLMWLLMLYVVFFAYKPTEHLGLSAAMVTFLMGGLAMLAPVQGGIGPWHFMVIETLFIYGIPRVDGKIFALIAHSSTNLIYLVVGLIALLLLPLLNARR